ncbi:hypothetical protein ACS0TY_003608 [Phlomoides rotata]
MDHFGNPIGHDADSVNRTVRGRRSWSKVEEDALILCLIDVVHEGWKSENGFRAGFQRELEKDAMQDMEDNNTSKPTDSNLKATSKGKKIKSCDLDITMLVDSLGEFMKYLKVAMTDLSAGVEKGSVSSNENKRLNDIMKGIVGLKLSHKLKICHELVQNSNCLDFL